MRVLLLATVGMSLSCAQAAPSPPAPPLTLAPGFWEHWGDGQGELAGYQLDFPRYGELRHGEAVLVTVTEDFTHATRVKSDGGHDDTYPVLKLNTMLDFQTGVYDYHAMTSTFVRLDQGAFGAATKVALGVQEWCGLVHEQLLADVRGYSWEQHSYFDGEADRHASFPQADVWAEDALPLWIRGWMSGGPTAGESLKIKVLPSLLSGRLAHVAPSPQPATLTHEAGTTAVTTPAGTFEVSTWRLVREGRTTTWWVETALPHRLIGWQTDAGERALLTGSTRSPYWERHREGDEQLREALGLPLPGHR